MSIFDRQKKPIEFDKEPIKPFGADMDFRELNAGGGSKLFKVNSEGLFMGADNFTAAPFKVGFNGSLSAGTTTLTGTLTVSGGAIQTGASGIRIKISTNKLEGYDSSALRFLLQGANFYSYDTDGTTLRLAFTNSQILIRNAANLDNIYLKGENEVTLGTRLTLVVITAEYYFYSTHIEMNAKKILGLGDTMPNGAGTKNLGDATTYWNDVSYKTLTDRGCFFDCDNGVELQDDRMVSNVEAIKAIQKHPTKLSVHGLPALDYKTFPKKIYRPADKDGEILPRDENDNPYWYEEVEDEETKKIKKVKRIAADGVETTGVISILLGAIKELSNRIEQLEKKIT